MGLNIEVTYKDISDRSGCSEESLYGADLGLTIRVNTDNNLKTYEKVKSALIQSKFPYNDSKKEIGKSLEKMIGVIDSGKHGSFIVVYNRDGVKVLNSWDIENAGYDLNLAKGESLETFFNSRNGDFAQATKDLADLIGRPPMKLRDFFKESISL
ncbi:hypothetical protein [Paenibacillus periandrae]|uniref:hypothetical protein n=1 Tax=Paenibacillus periandrae TaxID=1761741 RepID=UPI001F08CEEA|nr:hypothetical protein [Paenibacillus periandrae]